jgi:NAD(P)-dependent dehydrogenase (short-subunit alcohol dehydrogenase family)
MNSLKNKVAIITGSEGDIGKAIVKKFKKEGAIVYGLDIKNGDDITQEIQTLNKVHHIGKKHRHIDILVNNAGMAKADYGLKILQVNLMAPGDLVRYVVPFMTHGGSIINITSLWSEVAGEENPWYGASKGGLKILTKCMARDLAKYNIRANNVGFGYIKTEMTKNGWKNKRKEITNRTMLGRWGEPKDVVGLIAFLCTDEASYITGADFYIDGGWLAKGL